MKSCSSGLWREKRGEAPIAARDGHRVAWRQGPQGSKQHLGTRPKSGRRARF